MNGYTLESDVVPHGVPLINEQINGFLQVSSTDLELVTRYQQPLLALSGEFSDIFFNYLFGYPPTASLINQFLRNGNNLPDILNQQQRYIEQWLTSDIGTRSARRMIEIGKQHFHHNIDSNWAMLSFQFISKHFINSITDNDAVPQADKRPLQDALSKLLFRDMGLLLEGYGRAAAGILRNEQKDVNTLQAHMANLIANMPYIFWSVDINSKRILYVSPGTDQSSITDILVPIPRFADTVHEDREKIIAAWQDASTGERQEIEGRVVDKSGTLCWQRYLFTPCKDHKNRVLRVDGCIEDITNLKETMARLQHLATTDTLTELANRALWYDRMNMAISAAQRRPGHRVAIMMLDMNHFKLINDTMGHPVGDNVLRQAAQRMKVVLRDADTLARIGGDEFGILLSDTDDVWLAAKNVAKKVLGCFVEPFSSDGNNLYLGASIGVAIFPDHGQDADALVSRADIAMYRAKHRNAGYLFYNPGTDLNAIKQLHLSNQLRQALQRQELELHFQPKINLLGKNLSGVEALLRWRHPQHGLMEPDNFIPLAEQLGIMAPITEWVIHNALDSCAQWRAQGIDLPLAVNISALCLQNHDLVKWIRSIIKSHKTAAHCLELEITENSVMGDVDQNFDVLMSLNELGVKIAIDDFGTGYSSLAYLKRLPINTLKIDKSFVMDMAMDDNDAVIVRSIIELGHNLGFTVVAEGVESTDIWDLLNILGCDEAQGFHISPPLPEPGLLQWIQQGSWRV